MSLTDNLIAHWKFAEMKSSDDTAFQKNTIIFTAGGIGDQILGIQCAVATQRQLLIDAPFEVVCLARDEVFKPLNYLFGDILKLSQHPEKEKWGENNWILNNPSAMDTYPHPFKYYVTPDLLFRNPYAFDYERFNLHPNTIRETRCITHKRQKPEKIVYVALNTSTPEYVYSHTPSLLLALATALPDYTIYFNNITKWAGHSIFNGDFSGLPSNVLIKNNEEFTSSLDILMKSDYCVCLDNGISHIAYQIGIPRTLLSQRLDIKGWMWQTRWYPKLTDCVDYSYSPNRIARLIKTNLSVPQTAFLPRTTVIENLGVDWSQLLGFKY